jgi:hypothetical protein
MHQNTVSYFKKRLFGELVTASSPLEAYVFTTQKDARAMIDSFRLFRPEGMTFKLEAFQNKYQTHKNYKRMPKQKKLENKRVAYVTLMRRQLKALGVVNPETVGHIGIGYKTKPLTGKR